MDRRVLPDVEEGFGIVVLEGTFLLVAADVSTEAF